MQSKLEESNMKLTIVFDSECGVCNSFLWWVYTHDPEFCFEFAPLKSNFAFSRNLTPHSVHVCQGQMVFSKSVAIKMIVKRLKGQKNLSLFLELIPRVVFDMAYDLITPFRKLIFKKNACRVDPDFRARFVESQN